MSDYAPDEVIQRLEKRHDELIVELDSLNTRLEQALNSLSRPSAEYAADIDINATPA